MKKKSLKSKILVVTFILIGFVLLGRVLLTRCFEQPSQLDITSAINIHNLYPWPGAKIPFACHALAFLKSPFAPRKIELTERVFKEDGIHILGGYRRDGVVVAKISVAGELWHLFPEPVKWGETPPFAKAVSLYVDGKKLQIGHIGFREFDNEFNFTTILNPFLLPGEHVGKIVVLLPSGETLEYEWHFEITLW